MAGYDEILDRVARELGLDPDLVRAIVLIESSGDPWAVRYEPAFYYRYVRGKIPGISITEEVARATSWGLMQVMGQVARERGFQGKFLSALCDPETGLRFGALHLKRFLDRHGDVEKAVAAYNAGSPRMANGRFVNQAYVDKVMREYRRLKDVGMA